MLMWTTPTGWSPSCWAMEGWMTLPVAPVSIMPLAAAGSGSFEPALLRTSSTGVPTQTRMSTSGPIACRLGNCVVNDDTLNAHQIGDEAQGHIDLDDLLHKERHVA